MGTTASFPKVTWSVFRGTQESFIRKREFETGVSIWQTPPMASRPFP